MIDRFEGFVGKISTINKNIEKIKKIKMKKFGLGGNHVMSLCYLSQYKEGLTAARLCELISVDKAAMSRTLSELVEKGYVYYPENANQKKYRAVTLLTDKGKEVAGQMEKIITDIVAEIGGCLTYEEGKIMYYTLDIVSGKIEKLANAYVAKERI